MNARAAAWASIAAVAWHLSACVSSQPQSVPASALDEATLALSTPAAEPAPVARIARGRTREVSLRERRAVAVLMADAARVRELAFARDVPVLVQDPEAITDYVDSQIESREVERASAVYGALGLLAPELDIRALWLRLMSEQVVGYYDIEHGRLSVRDDVMHAFAQEREEPSVDLHEARVVLVHELVHALQDQHLGLSQSMKVDRDTDAENALRALVEGDATLSMIAHTLEQEALPLSELTRSPARIRGLAAMVRESPMAGTELENAPAIVRVPLLSAYVDGLSFVATLHGAGGFARVNRAYAEPPVSTEQVLHPERFARREAPERITLPAPERLLGDAYSLLLEDTLGELELSVYFAQGVPHAAAARAADGWGGDRLYAFQNATGHVAIVWLTRWDHERHALEAERAARAVVERAPAAERSAHLVERLDRSVLIVRHVDPAAHDAVRARFTAWAGGSAGTLASVPPLLLRDSALSN